MFCKMIHCTGCQYQASSAQITNSLTNYLVQCILKSVCNIKSEPSFSTLALSHRVLPSSYNFGCKSANPVDQSESRIHKLLQSDWLARLMLFHQKLYKLEKHCECA